LLGGALGPPDTLFVVRFLRAAKFPLWLARDSGATIVCATDDPVVIEHADEELKLQTPVAAHAAAANAVAAGR
jgi:hypothetical protein